MGNRWARATLGLGAHFIGVQGFEAKRVHTGEGLFGPATLDDEVAASGVSWRLAASSWTCAARGRSQGGVVSGEPVGVRVGSVKGAVRGPARWPAPAYGSAMDREQGEEGGGR